MEIEIQLTSSPIEPAILSAAYGSAGAQAEFRGIVRAMENEQTISALEYEAYSPMAENEMRRILQSLNEKHPCLAARVIHRIGVIPVGETAIYVAVTAKHRGEAFAMLAGFMDRLKQDVPIWKRRAIPAPAPDNAIPSKTPVTGTKSTTAATTLTLDVALEKIITVAAPLPPVRVPIAAAAGRILRETVNADDDHPSCDRSTRDGYAVLENDSPDTFSVVDTLHAADWKPRQLKTGEAVKVATGTALPCENLRVVMQENVERNGSLIKIVRRESDGNVRKRGSEMRAGAPVLNAGTKLNAGELALLATIGCANPLVSPTLRVCHFTIGDELVPLHQKPEHGQIRDSNSTLIRALLQKWSCKLAQMHLPEDFENAKRVIESRNLQPSSYDLLLVSGGASVGEKDFTRSLLEWLGFEIVFNRINLRPGAPLIFGVNDSAGTTRIGFGLPGNPLSHFVCFHAFVSTAIARLTSHQTAAFINGKLAATLEDSMNPRETLWPAKLSMANGNFELAPLPWTSSGDVRCMAETTALMRIPANTASLAAGSPVQFIPTN